MTGVPQNCFKAALRDFRPVRGLWCTIADPMVAEMLAGCGFDWLLFDTEHSPMDPLSVAPMLQAVAPSPAVPVVRPGSLNPVEIKKLLDLGAQSILVPMVQSAEEARLAVASVEYPPKGIRGVSGITRATRFGTVAGYHAGAREEIALIVQVETKAALARIEEIAAVDGVDGIFVGPADLAADMGLPGQPSHPEVQAAVLDAITRIRAAGRPPGLLTLDPSFLSAAEQAGAVFLAGDVDMAALRRSLLVKR